MAIPFVCPHCGLKTDVDGRYAGQSGPCAGCGQTVVIPWPGVAGGPGRPAPSGGLSPVAIVVIVVVVLLLVLLVCGGLLFGTFFLRMRSAGPPMRGPVVISSAPTVVVSGECSNNLKRIGLALHNYHDVYKCFPPAYVADEKGKPKHSWRVLLLPFVEKQNVYAMYNFKDPFDGPANRVLATTVVSPYQCPESPAAATANASYVMLVGPGTLSDGPKSTTMADVRDGTSNTIAIVEIPGAGVNWMEPKDVTLDEFLAFFPRPGSPSQAKGSNHPGFINVLILDGSTRRLPTSTPAATIRAMATIAGGEVVSP